MDHRDYGVGAQILKSLGIETFDQFENFEQRGKFFNKKVKHILIN